MVVILRINPSETEEKPRPNTKNIQKEEITDKADKAPIIWTFGYESNKWSANSTPPECPNPLVFNSPVDLNLVSGILYPGQLRGYDYKPHGGFRFDNLSNNEVEVRAIMDGYILKASRYSVDGEVQNLLFYVNECGIMIMHDHLLTLSPKLKTVFDKLPQPKEGDSRTTNLSSSVLIKKGEILATEVGFKKNRNIFLDFGMYDLRKTKEINYDETFRKQHSNVNEYGTHALCWLNNLIAEDKVKVKQLPTGGIEGKTSDYCD